MGALSKILRNTENNGLMFECPGCEMPHLIRYGEGAGPRWTWNGNVNKPTFSPSVLVKYTWGPKKIEMVCHSFVVDGNFQFLSDCTHKLAGQTVPIPEWDTLIEENDEPT